MDRFENLPAQTREQLSIKREQLRQWRFNVKKRHSPQPTNRINRKQKYGEGHN